MLPSHVALHSPPNDLPPKRSQYHRCRRNYFRIWESPLSEVPSPQEVSQDHKDLKEDVSIGTVLRGLFRQTPIASPNLLPDNVNDQISCLPVPITNVYNGRNASVSPMIVPQEFLSTPHQPPPSSNTIRHSHLTEGFRRFFNPGRSPHPSNQARYAAPGGNTRGDETNGFNDAVTGTFCLRDEAGPSEPGIIDKYSGPSKLVTAKDVSSAHPLSQKVSYTESSSEADHVYETLGTKRQCKRESYVCDLCKRIFSRELELKVHKLSRRHQSRVRRRYGTDTFVCTQCGYTGDSPEAVVVHYGYSHLAPSSASSPALSNNPEPQPSHSFTDPSCSLDLNSATELTSSRGPDCNISSPKSQPLPSLPGDSRVTDPNVASSEILLANRPLPITQYDGATRYACAVCKITLNRPSDLFRHNRSTRHRVACGESVVPKYECPDCQLAFSRTDAVKRHMVRSCRKRYVEIS